MDDVSSDEMSRSFDPDDLAALGETFAEDLRSAFPEVELPERVVQDHVAAMISAAQLAEEGASVLESASHPGLEGLTTPRRRWMRTRLIRRVVVVAAGLLLSLSGLAFAGAFEGSDPVNDDTTAVVTDQTDDDQGEDADDQGEDENANDDQGDNENADDQGEDADEQGEDADDQGEDENANDDQGEDENADDDQGDGGDSQD